MSNMKKTSLKLLGTALASAFLASCGGESTNLPEPVRPIVSTCTADNCVSGIFVADGVVEGLNYECGNIRSKTTFQGEFSCPLDEASSKVTFVISHADTGNRVTLGEYTFRPVFTRKTVNGADASTYEAVPTQTTDKRVFVTPRELTGEQFTSGFSDRALGITALLHSLDTDFTAGIAVSPASIVNLSEANKLTFLSGLPATVNNEPRKVSSIDADFISLVNTGLTAIDPGREILPNLQDYIPIAQQATHALASGIYHASEPILLISLFNLLDKLTGGSPDIEDIDLYSRLPLAGKTKSAPLVASESTCTASDCYTSFGYMSFGVDRSGRLFGFGASEARLAGVVQNDPLAVTPALNQQWPISGDLKNIRMNIRNSDTSLRPESIIMTQGVVDQGSMAAAPLMYMDYFGTDASDNSRLGRWQLKNGSTILMGGGSDTLPPRMELHQSYNSFPILNPDVWNGITFPIHLQAVITCKATEPCGSVEVNFTVLADGNIISDKDKNCSPVDANLLDGASTQELPIGVVTRAFANDGASGTGGKYLIPLMLLPSELVSSTEVRQIEIGTSASARLRLDNGSFGMYSNVSESVDAELSWNDVYYYNKSYNTSTGASSKSSGTIVTSKAACAP